MQLLPPVDWPRLSMQTIILTVYIAIASSRERLQIEDFVDLLAPQNERKVQYPAELC